MADRAYHRCHGGRNSTSENKWVILDERAMTNRTNPWPHRRITPMQCDTEDDEYLAPVNDSPGFGWMRVYCHLAGCIQMLFAVFLGWLALGALPGLAHDIAHHGEYIGKGDYVSISPRDLFVVTVFSL